MEPAESAFYSFCDTHQIPTLVGTISSWFGFWRGAKQLASFIGDASFIDKVKRYPLTADIPWICVSVNARPVSYTHLRAHET